MAQCRLSLFPLNPSPPLSLHLSLPFPPYPEVKPSSRLPLTDWVRPSDSSAETVVFSQFFILEVNRRCRSCGETLFVDVKSINEIDPRVCVCVCVLIFGVSCVCVGAVEPEE
jgi:hypothetical protein